MTLLSVKVARKVVQAEDIVSLELVSPDGKPLPAFSAGSHIDVCLKDGLIRQYSLWNDPGEQHRYLIGVLKDAASRGGSVAIHDLINVGDTLQISEPRNRFQLVPASRTLLLAGGIGITPLLCMARHLAHLDADFDMHYCTRSPERTAFHGEISNSAFANNVHFHFDNGTPEQKLNLADVIAQPKPGTHLYVCGPTGFIDYVINAAREIGWPHDQLHLEYFAAAEQDTAGDTSFQVKVSSTGQIFTVAPGSTITKVLEEHGVFIPVSCEEGVCGTCLTGVLEGRPDHRDLYLTDEERAKNDQFTPCCSRSKSAMLVLDL
ncbi:MAG TPA: PDR/VanB family oxidoreductase [Eoetvoesiella sp.]